VERTFPGWRACIILSSSSENFFEEEVVMIDDQNLRSREQEGDQFSSKGTTMIEQEAAIDVQLFSEEQYVTYFPFQDLVAVFMDLYFSENLKISDCLSFPMFMGDSFRSTTNDKGRHQISVLRTKENHSRYQEEGKELNIPEQQSIVYVFPTDFKQRAFNNEISKGSFQ
jgi:hypothetical protein